MPHLFGTNGPDLIEGGAGGDDIFGRRDNDTLLGHEGRDRLHGEEGSDLLDGGAGDDQLFDGDWGISDPIGGSRADTLIGGEGDDTLSAADGDLVDGGDGTDVFHLLLKGQQDIVSTFGPDGVDLSDGTRLRNVEEGSLLLGAGADTVSLGGIEASLWGGAGDDHLAGGDLNDELLGQEGADHLQGQGGADWLDGQFHGHPKEGQDSLEGGSGDDHVLGGIGDTLHGGEGYDRVTLNMQETAKAIEADFRLLAGGGRIVLQGGTVLRSVEHGWFYSGSGGDLIRTGATTIGIAAGGGNDTLLGGAADDIFIGEAGDDYLDGGAGSDTASYAYSDAAGVMVSLARPGVQDTRGSGADTLVSVENLEGSGFADQLFGDDGVNRLVGGGGDDRIEGGAGNDYLRSGWSWRGPYSDSDTLIGGVGQDVLEGGYGEDVFVFRRLHESRAGRPDTIVDLGRRDLIDVSIIDADQEAAGDQAFSVSATGELTGLRGQLAVKFDPATGRSSILLDVNGDAVADAVVSVTGDASGFTNWVL